MLQHAILHRCANVIEILTTQNLIRSTDTAIMRRFLAICLHRIFRACLKSHVFCYDWSYVEFLCNCVRYNTVKRNFADAKQTVRQNYCLSRAYHRCGDQQQGYNQTSKRDCKSDRCKKGIAKGIAKSHFTEESLPKELLDKLNNLHISEGT